MLRMPRPSHSSDKQSMEFTWVCFLVNAATIGLISSGPTPDEFDGGNRGSSDSGDRMRASKIADLGRHGLFLVVASRLRSVDFSWANEYPAQNHAAAGLVNIAPKETDLLLWRRSAVSRDFEKTIS
jgi:hypothetical protein